MAFVILTGASGSGKTTIAEAVAARYGEQVEVYHFDSIGVPPPGQMIANYGSGEAWQRAMTYEWIKRVAATPLIGRRVLLEGQMRLSFVIEATTALGISDYVLITCGLRRRNQDQTSFVGQVSERFGNTDDDELGEIFAWRSQANTLHNSEYSTSLARTLRPAGLEPSRAIIRSPPRSPLGHSRRFGFVRFQALRT
jgi:energy-coupling factor transporter ATP-binding protein EcfA2